MRFVTVTELKQRATQIVSQIQASGEEMVITKNGKPVVLMRTVDEKEIVLIVAGSIDRDLAARWAEQMMEMVGGKAGRS